MTESFPDCKGEMVVGFMFRGNKVLLIKKNRPPSMAGLFNGVGGHVKLGETPHEAMVREFEEEAGIRIWEWKHFCTLRKATDASVRIHFFAARTRTDDPLPHSATDEQLHWFEDPYRHGHLDWIQNLRWLVPLARQADSYDGPIFGTFY